MPPSIGLYFLCICALLLAGIDGVAAEPADSAAYHLNEVSVTASGQSSVKLLDGGDMRFNTSALAFGSRSMGEIDVVNSVKHIAGVNTVGDYGAGLMVDGAESSQTVYRIDRVPVFFPYRFGGIFSTFNTPHFRAVHFSRNIHDASFPARLGARFDFEAHNHASGFEGLVNVGLLSSSATLKLPVFKRFSAIVSGRISYVDQIYGPWLRKKETDLFYDFNDFNVTLNYEVDEDNVIYLNWFRSNDHLRYDDSNYVLGTSLRWKNDLLSVHWRHVGPVTSHHRLYVSRFSNKLNLSMPQFYMDVPSSIGMYGLAGDINVADVGSERVSLSSGYEVNGYDAALQSVDISGLGREYAGAGHGNDRALEIRTYAGLDCELSSLLNLKAGLSCSGFLNSDGYKVFSIDPRLTLSWRPSFGLLSLHLGKYRQFLHQVGFSETGMSSDFWLTANYKAPAQTSYSAVVNYSRSLAGTGMALSVEAYWRRVLGQPEYNGQILDLLDVNYDAYKYLIEGDGHNLGLFLILRKDAGLLNFTLSGGFGVARRRYAGLDRWIRGRTDPGFSFNADVGVRLDSHWDLGAVFALASGRPYTPARAMYVIAGNLITEYGDLNSARFPTYHRLDLSATWHVDQKAAGRIIRHLVNFTLINAYGHRNVELRKQVVDIASGTFGVKEVASLYRFLPSLGYTIQF